jgi:hypothetical protein
MNKIVFAHTMAAVEKGQEKEAEFITSYKVGERLYVRNYFDNSIANYLQPTGMDLEKSLWFQYFIYLDGVLLDTINTESMSENNQKYNWTTFRDVIATSDNSESNRYVSARAFDGFLERNLDKLLTGKHTLKLELVPNNYMTKTFLPPVAVGEISVEGPADLLNSGYCFNKKTMSNPAVSTELLKTANKGNKSNGVKVTKVLLLEDDWREIRGQATGAVMRKEIEAVNIGTEENGKKCYYQYVIYAKTLYPAKGEDPNYVKSLERGQSMPCSCMNVIK